MNATSSIVLVALVMMDRGDRDRGTRCDDEAANCGGDGGSDHLCRIASHVGNGSNSDVGVMTSFVGLEPEGDIAPEWRPSNRRRSNSCWNGK